MYSFRVANIRNFLFVLFRYFKLGIANIEFDNP